VPRHAHKAVSLIIDRNGLGEVLQGRVVLLICNGLFKREQYRPSDGFLGGELIPE
jgi:hypothetical protein